MIDFITYVVQELKAKRLSKKQTLSLIEQFSAKQTGEAVLHPLLHANTSDIELQSYRSTFDGSEFFLDHHRVGDVASAQKVLPGVAYLEMACAAIRQALPPSSSSFQPIRLSDVVWRQPIVVNQPTSVIIALYVAGDDSSDSQIAVDFEIYSSAASSDDPQSASPEQILHCQGTAWLIDDQIPAPLDVNQLQQNTSQSRISAAKLYSSYSQMGVQFGASHQGVVEVCRGQGELLVQLQLPQHLLVDANQYILHPCLLDSALQGAIGFYGDLNDFNQLPSQPSLPFALTQIDVFAALIPNGENKFYGWIRHSDQGTGSDIIKLDIDLFDSQGNICVRLSGFTSRTLSSDLNAGLSTVTASKTGTLIAAPSWLDYANHSTDLTQAQPQHFDFDKVVTFIVGKGVVGKDREQVSSLADVLIIPADGSEQVAKGFQQAAKGLLKALQNLSKNSAVSSSILCRLLLPVGGQWQGLVGLLRTLHLENPNVHFQVVKSDASGDTLKQQLQTAVVNGVSQFDEANSATLLQWQALAAPDEGMSFPVPYKEHGVYVITGGLGGLGVIFAKDILAKSTTAKVILTGRSKIEDLQDKKHILLGLNEAGLNGASAKGNDGIERAFYQPLDITDQQAIEQLVATITKQHGAVNGIFHSAGSNADSLIVNKTEQQLAQVFAPKVTGLQWLDEATKALELDFLVLFSSGAGVLGNTGQGDYAMANGFMDAFAHSRNAQVNLGNRFGHTLSINWPLWAEGGMGVDAQTAERMFDATGMQPMPTDAGLAAFYQSIHSGLSQTLVMQGQLGRLQLALNDLKRPAKPKVTAAPVPASEPQPKQQSHPQPQQKATDLHQQTLNLLRKELSGLLRMPAAKIEPNAQLEQYGIDSILTMDLTNKLEKTFGQLPKTLFFEYQTVNEVTGYFLEHHSKVLNELFKSEEPTAATHTAPLATKVAAKAAKPALTTKGRGRFGKGRLTGRGADSGDNFGSNLSGTKVKAEPIAIVGLSGRYPQGWDLADFWQNLKNGKDCVTEVPKQRWDWQAYYSEDRNKPGSHYSKWGGFIEGVDEFDPLFFGIVPVGAEYLDPQERLFLQHAWMAIEDAGFTKASLQIPRQDDLAGQVGVYAGVMYGEYQLFGAQLSQLGNRLGFAGNPASIANRVSYVLNLHGPSMTVDTMCSSSLTAIHIACEDLNKGHTDLALAGGVNVSVHPNKYLMISAGQFISSEGQCQSFGEGGDGYIPAEGVGVTVLQRLSDAQAGGRHIYGVIKGSALSHGGKTNGYTVPNPKAQSSAISKAIKAANIDARHISYIEAHGTGTKLGDPIEIAALSNAFAQQESGFCRIGSAKSNVGHCEAAAGIAGLTKVLLQMRHQQIVPSLHSSKLNPHIDFERTPFVVNQQLTQWQQPVIDGKTLPRIAGISSFGAGGSNAHLIVEQFTTEQYHQPTSAEIEQAKTGPYAVVLSARTQKQLRDKALQLQRFIEGEGESESEQPSIDLSKLAYTLQLGREAMDERLGLLANNVEELCQKLTGFLAHDSNIDDLFTGGVKQSKQEMSLLNADDDMMAAIDNWIAANKLGKLLELWVKGLAFDWLKLYPNSHGGVANQFISLPTYPFARDSYWVDLPANGDLELGIGGKVARIHPLLHTNNSDLTQQSYRSNFTGQEFFLADHQVKQNKMLPAVAYLEMVRAAVVDAMPQLGGNDQSVNQELAIEIHNVVWVQPIVVDELKTIGIALSPKGPLALEFEVYSAVAKDRPQEVIHAQGQVRIFDKGQTDHQGTNHKPAKPLAELQARQTNKEVSVSHLYGAFEQMGIHYGDAYQAITHLKSIASEEQRSQGNNGLELPTELLAELTLPDAQLADLEQFILHPSLLDSALHASMGFSDDLTTQPKEPPLPFALDTLTIHQGCTASMVAHIGFSDDSSAEIVKLDINLYNDKDQLAVQMAGFTSRELNVELNAEQADDNNQSELLLAQPIWQDKTPSSTSRASSAQTEKRVLLIGDWPFSSDQLANKLTNASVQTCQHSDDFIAVSITAFNVVKQAIELQQQVQIVAPVNAQAYSAQYSALSGLIKTAILEQPQFKGQLILTDAPQADEIAADELAGQLNQAIEDTLICYQGNKRQVQTWQRLAMPSSSAHPLKDHGVYVITGGLGGLGVVFCQQIITLAPQATIVLTGRGELVNKNDDTQALFAGLASQAAANNGQVIYQNVDLSEQQNISNAFDAIESKYGNIAGIFHSAGMTADNFISNKTAQQLTDVLNPKVNGTINLDGACAQRKIDFLVLFSSVSGAMGNVGQADYAIANGYLDKFATTRNNLQQQGLRYGHCLSVNWPLWADGGMQLDSQAIERLAQTTGAIPLQTAAAFDALWAALEQQCSQVLVMQGQVSRMLDTLNRQEIAVDEVEAASESKVSASVASESLTSESTGKELDNARRYLTEVLAELLKMPMHEIQPDNALENYGIDSILAMNLTHQLEQRFGSLSKTLFFEYQTLNQLAAYFAKSHSSHFAADVSTLANTNQTNTNETNTNQTNTNETRASKTTAAPQTLAKRQSIHSIRDKQRFLSSENQAQALQQVAIVGLAGSYPGADSLDEFWQNLLTGQDSVSEIPLDRWDHNRYFTTERNIPGTSYSKWGGFINDVDKFDSLFFNISPNEAKLIDPQERLFLQTAWHAMEDAGYSKTALAGSKIGVYVGVMYGQYELYGAESIQAGQNVIATSSFASIANRVSYFFDFNGPSIALDTMCSSSLTALHLATEAIASGQLDGAIAGGVNVTIHPHKYLNLSQGNFVASDGRCRSFGAGGDGYVPGEGVGAVVLRPLNQALTDGNQIYGLVKATSLNHGGKTNGYTVPNPVAQGDLIQQALQQANIAPSTLGYLETHGTGTSLGDPVEINGLCRAFEGYDDNSQYCPIGSVKSNIGHLESAAGIAALTKVLLQIKHGKLAPSIHATNLNPNIDFAATPFYVQREACDFVRPSEHPRRVGISSFGAGGANGHVIIEEHIDTKVATIEDNQAKPFVLSATNLAGLKSLAAKVNGWLEHQLESSSALSFTDLVYTAGVGRTALNERLVVIAQNTEQLQQKLSHWLAGKTVVSGIYQGNIKKSAASSAALVNGEAGAIFLKTLLDNRDVERIAQLWIDGVDIDWKHLYANQSPKRIHMPLYPFAKERHWVDAVPAVNLGAVANTQPSPSTAQLLHYQPVWQNAQLSPATTNTPATTTASLWTIGLEPIVANCIELTIDDKADTTWQQRIASQPGDLPEQIIYQASSDDFYRLVDIIQGVMARKPTSPLQLVCIAQNDNPEHLALAGLLKTMNQENPNLRAKLVEVNQAIAASQLVDELEAELSHIATSVEQIRYAGVDNNQQPSRQVKGFSTIKPPVANELPLKQAGVYLISGGLGGLGLIFARYLAKHFAARLVLLGRSALNSAGNNAGNSSAGEQKLAELEQLGAKAIYIANDVTDLKAVKQAIKQTVDHFGGLNGVIHSAGVNQDDYIINKKPAQLAKVIGAKVAGTQNLDAATADIDLDLFVMFSSVAGAMGNPGQCDYAYGNAFMDAFAQLREQTKTHMGKSLSINWPLWAEGGMQLSAEQIERTEQHTGLKPLPVQQGVQSFSHMLSGSASQVMPLYGNASVISRYFSQSDKDDSAQATNSKITSTPMAKGGHSNLLSATGDYLKGLIGEQTGLTVERIDVSEPLESFGFDSMMISRFNAQLEADLGSLPKTLLYEYESIEALAPFLVELVAQPLTDLLLGDMAEVAITPQPEPAPVQITQTIAEPAPVQQAVTTAPALAPTPSPEPSPALQVAQQTPETSAIAIIGLAGRFPQSNNLDEYWQHLAQGHEMIAEVPAERWDAERFFDADVAKATQGKIYSKWGGFIDDVSHFDAEFFNIEPLDAKLMDPQERLFLQSCWSVIEDAGYSKESLKHYHPKVVDGAKKAQNADVGVFVGVTSNTYQMLAQTSANQESASQNSPAPMLTPSAMPWSIANRVSYSLNLQGPSMPIDTACSSSLVALAMACDSINQGDCTLAIAGGVNLYLHQYKYQSLCNRQMLASGSKTYSFGADGDGFVASEGVGCVLLKSLSQAQHSGDHIYGVISGASFSHSGRANGYSAPNPTAQGQVIVDALNKAQVKPQDISYIEGHGTGTTLGDSLEVAAISQAFGKDLPKKFRCPLGSVKANIGHGESVAGMAGLAKVLMQLRHGQIAPSINCEPANPNINFATAPVRIARKLSPWRAPKGNIRRAMINSFGAGGVNACVVIEQAPANDLAPNTTDAEQLIVLSAKSQERLTTYAQSLLDFVRTNVHVNLQHLSFTLQTGRDEMHERVGFAVADYNQLRDKLAAFVGAQPVEHIYTGSLDKRRMRTGILEDASSHSVNELAKLWCEGKQIDFNQLHQQGVNRISLPTYPFAPSRHWIENPASLPAKAEPVTSASVTPNVAANTLEAQGLHPLINRNVSTLKSVCFASELQANQWYANDHQINGQALLPGAAMVEMSCVGGTLAAEQRVVRVSNIVWVKPLSFAEPQVQTKLYLKTIGDETEVELTSLNEDFDTVSHFQCQLSFADSNEKLPVPISIDLEGLKEDAQRSVSGEALYQQYRQLGFDYGQAFQTVQKLHCHDSYVLAELNLASSQKDSFEDYILHPSLLDGALQSLIGFNQAAEQTAANVPFALDKLTVYRPLTAQCFAYVTLADSQSKSGSGLTKFNIELVDENGMVLASLKDFYVRAMPMTQTHNQEH